MPPPSGFIILALPAAVVIFVACGRESYRADVYPDAAETHRRLFVGDYQTLADCRTAAHAYLVGLDRNDRGFYECGKNCRPWPVDGVDTLWHCADVTEVRGETVIAR